jgi:hypothetical protein
MPATEVVVTREALTVKQSAGSFCFPRKEPEDLWTLLSPRFVPSTFAAGASLVTEDDFELGGEFLEVWSCAGERVVGFPPGLGRGRDGLGILRVARMSGGAARSCVRVAAM